MRPLTTTIAILKMATLIADSGGTKTDWCIADDGRVEAHAATQGINPFHQDCVEIERIVRDELLPQLPRRAIAEIHFYGSGCREEFRPMVDGILRRTFPDAATVEVAGDLLGAARAVCVHGEGIACIIGTGSNSCLYDGENIVENTPPLGYILGDEGGGAVLGRLFLNAMYKGRLPRSVADDFAAETGLSMADVIGRVYRRPLANRFLASLSPFIRRHTDVVEVRRLVVGNFQRFFRNNVAPYRRPDLAVGFVGGMAAAYSEELSEAAAAEGFSVGRIVGRPLEKLAGFHAGGLK